MRIDCSDPVAAAATLADLAATTSIDAIVPVDDAGVVIAALASEPLGLPHNPPDAAAATRDKEAMRRALARGEVPQPAFAVVAPWSGSAPRPQPRSDFPLWSNPYRFRAAAG